MVTWLTDDIGGFWGWFFFFILFPITASLDMTWFGIKIFLIIVTFGLFIHVMNEL